VIHNETGLHPALSGARPLNVLCGYDFSKTADSALHWIHWIRTLTSCKVTLVYATTADADTGSSQESLTQRAAAILGDGSVSCRVVASGTHAGTVLADVAAAEKPDILVVGTHQRHGLKRLWLGSVSRKVLRETATNVAIVPATED
jgi:nucleotide-binding universal stress UspA family protein